MIRQIKTKQNKKRKTNEQSKQCRTTYIQSNTIPHVQSQTRLIEFDLSWLKSIFQLISNAGAHVPSQTHVFSLTWVWLKFKLQLKTNATAHVQTQTIFVFDLSLTKVQYSSKNHPGNHIQSQSQCFEFDLSLTKIHSAAKKHTKNPCSKSKSWVCNLIWVWLKCTFELKTNTDTYTKSNSCFWIWLEYN